MTRPPRREVPPRGPGNPKRRLAINPLPTEVDERFVGIRYEEYSKHKQHPYAYGLLPFTGERGDASLCDRDAGFGPDDVKRIPKLLNRARRAALVGTQIWTVDDNGWIYELAPTSSSVYHGYPIWPIEAIARSVSQRFQRWAEQFGNPADRLAAQACADRYGATP